MESKKILWPTDFSSSAERALTYINRMREEYEAEIHILYVIEDQSDEEERTGEFNEKHLKMLKEWADESAKKHIDRICGKISDEPATYVRHTAIGEPADEILNLAKKEHMDLIVMESHGQYGKVKPGSTSDKVLKNSPVPVATIPMHPI